MNNIQDKDAILKRLYQLALAGVPTEAAFIAMESEGYDMYKSVGVLKEVNNAMEDNLYTVEGILNDT